MRYIALFVFLVGIIFFSYAQINEELNVRFKSEKEIKSHIHSLFKQDEDFKIVNYQMETDRKGTKHIKYHFYYRDFRFENYQIAKHESPSGQCLLTGSFPRNYPNGDAPLSKSLDELLTINSIIISKPGSENKQLGTFKIIHSEKVLYFKNSTCLFAYKVDLFNYKKMMRELYYLDVTNGEIIHYEIFNYNIQATGSADTRYSGTRSITTEDISGQYYLHDLSRGNGIFTYNLDASNNISDFIDNDNNWSSAEYNNATQDNAALDAHWGMQNAFDYWKYVHGRNSYDNNNSPISSYIHYGSSGLENAFWTGTEILYGGGSKPLTCIDVVGHELGHAITEYTVGLKYSFESGALNEGFSDIWGACTEYYADPTKNIWLIGNEAISGGFRSMSNPNSKNHPDTYKGNFWSENSGYYDNGGVHTNSNVFNYWFYLLCIGGSGVNDHGFSYSVNGITIQEAEQICYQSRFYLTPNSQFQDARNAMIAAATDLYGAASNEVLQVKNAWDAVGVYNNPLKAPTNLTLNLSGLNTVQLNWSDNNVTYDGFIIERSYSPDFYFTAIDSVSSGIFTYSEVIADTNLVLYYRVRAYESNKTSSPSNVVFTTIITGTTITMINGSTSTCNGMFMDDGGLNDYGKNKNNVFTINPGIPGNKIFVDFTSFNTDFTNSFDVLQIYDGNNTSSKLIGSYYGDKGDTLYEYYNLIPGFICAGDSNTSGALTFKFVTTNSTSSGWVANVGCTLLPAAPSNLTAVSSGANSIHLNWNDNATNEIGYVIERSDNLGITFFPIDTVAANVSSYPDLNLSNDAIYYYRVRAYKYMKSYWLWGGCSNTAIDTLGTLLFTKINLTLPVLGTSSADWGDMDNDGDLDLLISGSETYTTSNNSGYQMSVYVYENQNSNMVNLGLTLPPVYGTVKWLDYDRDGDLDLYVAGGEAGLNTNNVAKIFRNQGNHNFVDANVTLPISFWPKSEWGDMDNDGDPDLAIMGYHISSGNNLYKNNAGTFVLQTAAINNSFSLGTTMSWGDYDNDGDLDLLTALEKDNVALQLYNNNNGVFSSINIGSVGTPSSPIRHATANWGDYDNDGDLDIMSVEYRYSPTKVAIVFYENVSGSFVKSAIELPGTMPVFADYDNDGDLDIIAKVDEQKKSAGYSTKGFTIIHRNDNGVFNDTHFNNINYTGYSKLVDYDNDNDLDLFLYSFGTGLAQDFVQLYKNNLNNNAIAPSAIFNNAPGAPSNLNVSSSSGKLVFHWDKGTDTETPQNALSYNIRIGTSAGGSQICSPSCSPAGKNKVVTKGNVDIYPIGGDLNINCLPAGTYYWSVQSVDHGFKGSAFATENSFTIDNTCAMVTGLAEAENKEIYFVYNGSDKDCYIQCNGNVSNYSYKVIDVLGREFESEEIKNSRTTINRFNKSPGMYIVTLYQGNVMIGNYKFNLE